MKNKHATTEQVRAAFLAAAYAFFKDTSKVADLKAIYQLSQGEACSCNALPLFEIKKANEEDEGGQP